MNMDVQQMITFITLAREKNFRRTAKILKVSQPTVTIRLKMLEQALNTELIKRSGTSLMLTPAGEIALQYMERMIRLLQKGKDDLSSRTAARKRLSIAAIPSFCTYLYPRMLNAARQFDQHIELQIGTSAEVLQFVLDGVSQLGVLRGPVHHPDLNSLLLYNEAILLAIPANHPLALPSNHSPDAYPNICIEHLLQEKFITYKRRFWSFLRARFLEHGGELRVHMRVDSEVTAKKMVMSGLGISLLPELALRNESQLNIRRIADCEIYRQAYLVFPKKGDEETVGLFYDWVQQSVGKSQ
jgi:DNA-binding transcriptional LysR family regulator